MPSDSTSTKRDASEFQDHHSEKRRKLHGREFYESIGSPKVILAPMVDQSEFAWRMLTRSFFPPNKASDLLAYSPMFHSRLFFENQKYRDEHFQAVRGTLPLPTDSHSDQKSNGKSSYLDGNTAVDRPLFVQFCSNSPEDFYKAAQHVQDFCDAVDLNLGCPQGIAKRGNYGAFLQEDQNLICDLIRKLHENLDVPVTAKMRVLDTREKTLAYAKRLLEAGASIITVHGRRREQKGHNTGVADWPMIRFLRDNLPPETVMFANGNILQHEDIEACLSATGADGVMSAEGNLHDPSIFAGPPPEGQESREYWRGRDGKGGYRVDAVFRRYMDILYRYVLEKPPPERPPLFVPGDLVDISGNDFADIVSHRSEDTEEDGQPPKKKQKRDKAHKKRGERETSPNLCAMQAHLFQLLRFLVSEHHDVRDALARSRAGDMVAYENVLTLVEKAVKKGLIEYESSADTEQPKSAERADLGYSPATGIPDSESTSTAVARCRRPWWVCQPYVRPSPKEALERGSMQLSKKAQAQIVKDQELSRTVGLAPEGKIVMGNITPAKEVEIPEEGVVCG